MRGGPDLISDLFASYNLHLHFAKLEKREEKHVKKANMLVSESLGHHLRQLDYSKI